ncbi:MAG TPA: DUF1707 domain-containing protein [Gemmatimonadales bacterium]
MIAPDLTRGVRASDAERERIAQLLQSAAAEGRLSPEEAGERLASASAATYREELQLLIADLPVARDPEAGERTGRPPVGLWFLWRAARVAFVVTLVTAWWGFWSVRLFLWPLGLLAVAFLLRPWRRPRWRMMAWRARRAGSETY